MAPYMAKNNFEDTVKDFERLSWIVQRGPKYNHSVLIRHRQLGTWQWTRRQWSGRKLWNACSRLKLQEAQKGFSSRASRVAVAVLTPWVLLSNTEFRVLAPKLWENKFLLSHQVRVNLLEQPQTRTTNAMENQWCEWRKKHLEKQFWKIQEMKRKARDKVPDLEDRTDSPHSEYWCCWLLGTVTRHQIHRWADERVCMNVKGSVTPFWTHLGGKDPPLGIPWEQHRVVKTRGVGGVMSQTSIEKSNKNQVDFRLVLYSKASMSTEALRRLEHLGVWFILCVCLYFVSNSDVFLGPSSFLPNCGVWESEILKVLLIMNHH